MKRHVFYFGMLMCLLAVLTGCKKKEEVQVSVPVEEKKEVSPSTETPKVSPVKKPIVVNVTVTVSKVKKPSPSLPTGVKRRYLPWPASLFIILKAYGEPIIAQPYPGSRSSSVVYSVSVSTILSLSLSSPLWL